MNLPFDPLPSAEFIAGGSWSLVDGARCGVARGRIKASANRDDVVVLHAPGNAAAVITRSTAAAAPCLWTRARVPGPIVAVVINSGNANAATGRRGEDDTRATAVHAAKLLGCAPDQVLVCSTGVIGVPMPMERLLPAISDAALALGDHGARAAKAILTTDHTVKEVACAVDGVLVAGMAKGSGMIHPNMGTMLAFLVTDAEVEAEDLQALLGPVVERSFNCVTVDGDTSTNDTVILQATGRGGLAKPGTPRWAALAQALEAACVKLARDIAADGEGATTRLEVVVQGLASDELARAAARAVARSPLVKSAIHGRDPNWGRVVGALGAAGAIGLERLDLDFCGVPVLRGGQVLDWDEKAASAAMNAPDVRVVARLPGPGRGRAWGCDLSADYVRINADYRS